MSEMKASVALNLTGNFEQRAERYGRAVGSFSRTSELTWAECAGPPRWSGAAWMPWVTAIPP